MISFNKQEIKDNLTTDNIFDLLQEWGGDPEYTPFGIISTTICHNPAGEGSRKLYYYENSNLFRCYTQCGTYFDIFELCLKVYKMRGYDNLDLNEAIRLIAQKFGMSGSEVELQEQTEDDVVFSEYERIKDIDVEQNKKIILKEYDDLILSRFNYDVRIGPWLDEGITQEVLEFNRIGFFPGNAQITIPHYDEDGRFIGLRGRTVVKEDAERYGKYRPMKVNGQLYNHPLGYNLFNYNNAKEHINQAQTAIIFEGEKSTFRYQSYFGLENDISTACCGSSVSAYQIQLLRKAGAKEIIIAFDRQFQERGDNEFKHLVANLTKLHEKYNKDVNISFIFDKDMITNYKDSPIDQGPDIFARLLKERVRL